MRVSSRILSHWYPRLASGLEAGLSLERCVSTNPGPPAALRGALTERLRAGESVSEALEHGALWLPEVDRQLIGAGAASGRLPDAMRRLAARHQETVRARVATILASLYPVGVAHLGALAFPIAKIVNGEGVGAYAIAVFKVLVPFWIVAIAFEWAVRLRLRAAMTALDLLPFVGGYRRNRALADLAYVLEAQLSAGIRLDIAWLQAAKAAGDSRFEPTAIAVAAVVQSGNQVGPVLAGRREIPALFADYYFAGETTGHLDENLGHIQRNFRDAASTQLKIATMVYPTLLFLVVAVWAAVQIVLFYKGYFNQFDEMLK